MLSFEQCLILFSSFPLLLAFVVGGLGLEFCVFVAGWRHALRSEWPFIIIIITCIQPRIGFIILEHGGLAAEGRAWQAGWQPGPYPYFLYLLLRHGVRGELIHDVLPCGHTHTQPPAEGGGPNGPREADGGQGVARM